MSVNAFVNLTEESATALHNPGEEYNANGATYIYAKANGALTAYDLAQLTVSASTGLVEAVPASTTTAGGTSSVLPAGFCIPQFAVTDDYYFWAPCGPFHAKEDGTFFYVNCGAAAVSSAKLYTTGTAGTVDDVSSSTVLIQGLMLLTAVTAAAEGKCIATRRLACNS